MQSINPKDNSAQSRAMLRVSDLIGTSLNNSLDEFQSVQIGISTEVIDYLLANGYQSSELEWIIEPSTLASRKKKQQPLSTEESDKCLRLLKIHFFAIEVFGNKEKSLNWLHKNSKHLKNQFPLSLIRTEAGTKLIDERLNQIDFGLI